MSAQSIPRLLTVDEFDRVPDPSGGRYELRHGEAVFVTFPVRQHKDLQRVLRRLLEEMAGDRGIVDTEFPYRPLAEHELWSADVAYVSRARYEGIRKWLDGSPELVIEVKSPGNTKAELHDKAMTTLAGDGAMEFWIVDGDHQLVTVYTRTSGMQRYGVSSAVPVAMLGGSIAVSDLFPAP